MHQDKHPNESGHNHDDHRHAEDTDTTRLILAVVFNGLITAAEFVAGIVAGSLTLLADAAHNLSDTASMGTSLIARKISSREADARRTFGYERAELIGAFINLLTLILIALYLIFEAVKRYFNPTTIDGTLMIWVGLATLLGNVATAFVLHKPSQDSLNIRSAFVHIVADALGSVAVVVGGVLILWYDWTLIDPILTVLIACYILIHSYKMLRETISILMESAPRDFDIEAMAAEIEKMVGVLNIHHIHVWRLDESRVALEAHVAIQGVSDLDALEQLKMRIKDRLRSGYGVDHATLEFEFGACTDEGAFNREHPADEASAPAHPQHE